jgi:hypothetical protein
MKLTKKDMKEFKTWMQALRSGKYDQVQGRLQVGSGFCCLGVACEVLIPDHYKEKYPYNQELKGGTPDRQLNAPSWLKDINDDFGMLVREESISTMNDRLKMSFEEIADVLEAVYLHKVLE